MTAVYRLTTDDEDPTRIRVEQKLDELEDWSELTLAGNRATWPDALEQLRATLDLLDPHPRVNEAAVAKAEQKVRDLVEAVRQEAGHRSRVLAAISGLAFGLMLRALRDEDASKVALARR